MSTGRRLGSDLFWIGVGGAFCVRALHYGLFKDGVPGPGLLPFLAGACLILLAALDGLAARLAPGPDGGAARNFFPHTGGARRAVSVLAAILAYPFLLRSVNYSIPTFLFLFFCLTAVGRQRAVRAALTAAICTLLTYLLFIAALGVRLPRGLLSF